MIDRHFFTSYSKINSPFGTSLQGFPDRFSRNSFDLPIEETQHIVSILATFPKSRKKPGIFCAQEWPKMAILGQKIKKANKINNPMIFQNGHSWAFFL